MEIPFPSEQKHTLWPTPQDSQILKPALTANLQDGLILYNISHSHSISTRVKSNQEAQHNAVPLIQEIYMTLKSVAKNHMIFMEAPISYRTCTWHSCTVNSLPSVDISDAYK